MQVARDGGGGERRPKVSIDAADGALAKTPILFQLPAVRPAVVIVDETTVGARPGPPIDRRRRRRPPGTKRQSRAFASSPFPCNPPPETDSRTSARPRVDAVFSPVSRPPKFDIPDRRRRLCALDARWRRWPVNREISLSKNHRRCGPRASPSRRPKNSWNGDRHDSRRVAYPLR